jgi:hypothetical protein
MGQHLRGRIHRRYGKYEILPDQGGTLTVGTTVSPAGMYHMYL